MNNYHVKIDKLVKKSVRSSEMAIEISADFEKFDIRSEGDKRRLRVPLWYNDGDRTFYDAIKIDC